MVSPFTFWIVFLKSHPTQVWSQLIFIGGMFWFSPSPMMFGGMFWSSLSYPGSRSPPSHFSHHMLHIRLKVGSKWLEFQVGSKWLTFLSFDKSHVGVGRRIRSLRRAKARRQGSAVRAFVAQTPLWTIVRQDEAGWMSFRVKSSIQLPCVNQSITLFIDQLTLDLESKQRFGTSTSSSR